LLYHRPEAIEAEVAEATRRQSDPNAATSLMADRLAAMQAELEGTHGYERYDVTDRLARINLPTLVMHGRYDVSNPLSWGKLIHEGIPGSEFVVFENSGHIIQNEEPEKFRETVRSFIRRLGT